jgi:Phage Tail Collar Domain
MGLETSTYISGLTASWPPSGDPKSQGDDHLRLIKGVLQATFPNANAAFYTPRAEATSGTLALDATDQNNVVAVTTTSADVSVTLPAGFDTTKAGWSCEVVKVSADVNAAVVTISGGGSIASRVGVTTSIRVGAYAEPCRFLWTGIAWIAVKPGPLVGSTFNWDGAAVPYGCLVLDGSAFNSTTFAELFAALGSATLKDKRGRAEIGSGTGSGLTNRVLGTVYGAETQALSTTHMAPYTPSGALSIAASCSTNLGYNAGGGFTAGGGIVAYNRNSITNYDAIAGSVSFSVASFTGNAQGGASTAFGLLQPSIGTQKLIRAC